MLLCSMDRFTSVCLRMSLLRSSDEGGLCTVYSGDSGVEGGVEDGVAGRNRGGGGSQLVGRAFGGVSTRLRSGNFPRPTDAPGLVNFPFPFLVRSSEILFCCFCLVAHR